MQIFILTVKITESYTELSLSSLRIFLFSLHRTYSQFRTIVVIFSHNESIFLHSDIILLEIAVSGINGQPDICLRM